MVGIYKKEFCCPLKHQSFTALVWYKQGRDVSLCEKKKEKESVNHGMGGGDEEKDKSNWGD